uniref:Protein E7 n=1 Tax=human papillomavirus 101 TaxID=915425 RepID=A0A7G2A974_9PAPI|nr:E7 [human papillomavirus 101]CAD1807591.1 E7 protein [human papillomavirus 101]CAD1807681.1 E7 protein [human papillomavirus 101]
MRGKKATIGDVKLELSPLVLPANLLCDELVTEEEEQQDEQALSPYRIVTDCGQCHKTLALHVLATDGAIRSVEQLLCGDLELVCASCIRAQRHGGQRQ